MTPGDVRAQFEAGTLDPAAFHHCEHVQLAWSYLRELPFLVAAERFTTGLRALAARVGKPGLYHETITWAYLLLIRERLARQEADTKSVGLGDWEQFAGANPDLLRWRGGSLERYYRPETLASPLAKAVFLLPDRGLEQRCCTLS